MCGSNFYETDVRQINSLYTTVREVFFIENNKRTQPFIREVRVSRNGRDTRGLARGINVKSSFKCSPGPRLHSVRIFKKNLSWFTRTLGKVRRGIYKQLSMFEVIISTCTNFNWHILIQYQKYIKLMLGPSGQILNRTKF